MKCFSNQCNRTITVHVICIGLSIIWGRWLLSICDIETLLIYLPTLVNFGIFLAATGCDIARRSPAERQVLLDTLDAIRNTAAGWLSSLANVFGGIPSVVTHPATAHTNNIELPTYRTPEATPGQF